MNYGAMVYSFEYNDEGVRTSKTVNGIEHVYTLNGSQIVTESWVQNNVEYFIVYLYDESGAPIGMQYRTSNYAYGKFDNYFFERNLFGDVVALYNEAGTKIGSYKYDAWGDCAVSVESTASTLEKKVVRYYNPFRYRGYYYDTETGYYYLQSRYYNPQWGRFLNADGYINANGDLIGYNMYAYCSNNPVMYTDPTGNSKIADWAIKTLVESKPVEFAIRVYAEIWADSIMIHCVGKSNLDPQAIADANWYSYYDNTLVIHNPIEGISSFAIGNTIVLSTEFKNKNYEREFTLKHERGHLMQEKDLGGGKYFVSVAIPSVLYYSFSTVMEKGFGISYFSDLYHSMPWEYKANDNTNNTKGNETPWAKDLSDKYYSFWKGAK